jgi:hypothetical protein
VAGRDLGEFGHAPGAVVACVGAAGVEDAPAGQIGGVGHLAAEEDAAGADARVGGGHGGDQRLGVGVLRVAQEPFGLGDLDDSAGVHDADPVAEVFDDGQVVRDEQQRQAELALQLQQQVEHLRLDGDVQGADGLVGDDQPRPHRQRARDADALALAAG